KPPPQSTRFPYTTLFRSGAGAGLERLNLESVKAEGEGIEPLIAQVDERPHEIVPGPEESKNGNHGQGWTYQRQHNMPVNAEKTRSEEHTSELQSPDHLVC